MTHIGVEQETKKLVSEVLLDFENQIKELDPVVLFQRAQEERLKVARAEAATRTEAIALAAMSEVKAVSRAEEGRWKAEEGRWKAEEGRWKAEAEKWKAEAEKWKAGSIRIQSKEITTRTAKAESLLSAVRNRDLASVKTAINSLVDINAQDKYVLTALTIATKQAWHPERTSEAAIVDCLLPVTFKLMKEIEKDSAEKLSLIPHCETEDRNSLMKDIRTNKKELANIKNEIYICIRSRNKICVNTQVASVFFGGIVPVFGASFITTIIAGVGLTMPIVGAIIIFVGISGLVLSQLLGSRIANMEYKELEAKYNEGIAEEKYPEETKLLPRPSASIADVSEYSFAR